MIKRKTFGEVKVGDALYFIKYDTIPSIVEVHASTVVSPIEDEVTITIKEKVPNDDAKEGEFEIDYIDKDQTHTFYDAYTTIEEAKIGLYNILSKKIKEEKINLAESILAVDKSKILIGKLENELTKYDK